jgi:G6PDH family F420-dependent oxidoreductase
VSVRGRHFRADGAYLHSRPERRPPIYVSAFGPKALDVAARIGVGFISTQPDAEMISAFKEKSGGRPAAGGVKVAWADTRDEGVDHAHRLWSNAGLPGELAQVLPSPQHFEQASSLVTRESTADSVVAGPDVAEHLQQLRAYAAAGYDEVYVANMGPHYLPMIEAYGREVLPGLRT